MRITFLTPGDADERFLSESGKSQARAWLARMGNPSFDVALYSLMIACSQTASALRLGCMTRTSSSLNVDRLLRLDEQAGKVCLARCLESDPESVIARCVVEVMSALELIGSGAAKKDLSVLFVAPSILASAAGVKLLEKSIGDAAPSPWQQTLIFTLREIRLRCCEGFSIDTDVPESFVLQRS